MPRLPVAIALLCSIAAFAGGMPAEPRLPASSLLAMGPDPGGHTGARVTPETTKTGRAEVDAARKEASGHSVENKSAPNPEQEANSRKPQN